MVEYNNFDEVFQNNKDKDNLDKMARKINMKRNEKNRKDMKKNILNGISAFAENTNFKFSPQLKLKSDFVSGIPTPLDEEQSNNSLSLSSKINSESMSSSYFDDVVSEYTYLPKKQKKIIKNNNHLKSFNGDDELVINHIASCEECRNKLSYLFNNNSVKKEYFSDNSNIIKKKSGLNYEILKDIIIVVIIGIVIIIILDIILSK